MKLLYATPYVPSRIRTRPYNLIRALVHLGHEVHLLTVTGSTPDEQRQADELRAAGVHVDAFLVTRARSLANCLRALPTREPLQAVYAHHPEMERRLGDLLRHEPFDIVHIEHLRAARLVRAVAGVPSVYDAVDCISLLFQQTLRRSRQGRSRLLAAVDLGRTRRYEAWLLTQFNEVVVTSARDKEALEGLARRYLQPEARPAKVTVVTNGVDLGYFQPWADAGARDSRTVIFTGKMSYHANVAAVRHFAREVLPRIWAEDAAVRFQIVGKDPPEAVRQLGADRRIHVTGTVDDLRPYLARATVAVCPALYAVGVQNKVLEAMAMGTPSISSPAGCAALEAVDGRDLLVAGDAGALAAAVLRVTSDPALAGQLSAAGRRYVERHHSWETAAGKLAAVYEAARLKAGLRERQGAGDSALLPEMQ